MSTTSARLLAPLVWILAAACGGDDDDGPDAGWFCPGEAPPAPPGLDPALEARVDTLLAQMTLDDKLAQMAGTSLGTVDDLWVTPANARLGIPGFHMIDGPRGVVAGHSTSFPVAMARGAAFDRDLERAIGEAIGREAAAHGADVVLAPCINVLRHPAWGRAQETYGEDSYHLGELGVAFVAGAQPHVIATAKHFAANSIEDTRFDVDVTIDARALREVYLPHFQTLVQEGRVGAIMSAYNSINGAYASENPVLLRQILKDEWGFAGPVMSDWVFGTHSAARAVTAGLDLEMPAQLEFGALHAEALRCEVSTAAVDDAVRRILRVKLAFALDDRPVVDPAVIESPAHAALALQAARQGAVLLRNQAGALPLDPDGAGDVAVIGLLADVANLGDEGSSQVDPSRAVTPLAGLQARFGAQRIVHVAADALDETTTPLVAAAAAAIVVVGLTQQDEGENIPGRAGGDRDTLALSPAHEALIAQVAAASPRTIVIVEGGSAIVMSSWLADVEAVLLAWYPGQEGGTAIAELLAGDVNPSGRLPLSIPVADADLPAFDHTGVAVTYGLFHGYRWLDRMGTAPAFAFGFGLSYGDVTYAAIEIEDASVRAADTVEVTVTVASVDRAGDEVVQLYVEPPAGSSAGPVERAVRELRGFQRITLTPGGTRAVVFAVPVADLARWDPDADAWVVDPGTYAVVAGPSSRQLPLRATFTVE